MVICDTCTTPVVTFTVGVNVDTPVITFTVGVVVMECVFLQQLKEVPEWMVKSTVHSETIPHGETTPNSEVQSQHQAVSGLCTIL